MSILHPRDPRWHGPARRYMYFDLVKNIVLCAYIVLVIVEGALYRHWYMVYHSTVEFDSDETAATFFVRIGLALVPDILSTILTHSLLPTKHFHPVYALTQALIVFCFYPGILTLNLIIVYSNETQYPYIDGWQRLCLGEMVIQGVLTLLWGALVGYACVAVHTWREVRGAVQEGVELESGKGRRDSGVVGEDGVGVVEGSVKSSRMFV